MAPHPPPSSLREENRQRTRSRIIETTAQLTRTSGHADFTMPQVAERSGVALRTLYRYFPKRQDLVDALATVADQATAGPLPQTVDDLQPWLMNAWSNLLRDEALLRAQHLGPGGTEVRKARIPFYRAVVDELIGGFRPDLSTKARGEIVDLALVLTSSAAMFEFTDIVGTSAKRGARIAAGAVKVVIETA